MNLRAMLLFGTMFAAVGSATAQNSVEEILAKALIRLSRKKSMSRPHSKQL